MSSNHESDRRHREVVECECGETFRSRGALERHQDRNRKAIQRVYNAVYRDMYDLCRDVRYLKKQMGHEAAGQDISPREFVENAHGHEPMEWAMENVRDISIRLVEASLYDMDNITRDDRDDWYPDGIDGFFREEELREIVEDVEAGWSLGKYD